MCTGFSKFALFILSTCQVKRDAEQTEDTKKQGKEANERNWERNATVRDTGDRFVQSSLSIQIILDLHDLSETALAEVRNIGELRSQPRLTRSHGQKGHGGFLLPLELEMINYNVGKTRSCNSALKLINWSWLAPLSPSSSSSPPAASLSLCIWQATPLLTLLRPSASISLRGLRSILYLIHWNEGKRVWIRMALFI